MKQTLLLVFCCLIVFAVTNAQKVRIADTTYSSEDNGAMLHLYDTRQLRYNEDCNNDAIYYLDYDFDSGSVDQKEYDTIEYDKNKLAYRYTYQYWNSVTNVYENSSRTTYTRDNSKNITSQLNEVWQNNSWHTQYFDSGEYNANNDKTYDLFETWDVYADTLRYAFRNTIVYDSAHHTLSNNQETYNYIPNVWIPTSQTINTYDANGHLIKSTNESWSIATSSWFLYTTTDYYNNTVGLIDSSIQNYVTQNTMQKWYYTYDGNTSRVSQSTGYYFASKQLIEGSRYTYYNVDNSSEYLDSTIQENLDLSESDSFSLGFTNVYHVYYNDDKTIHDYTYHYIFSPANYSFYNRTYYTYGPCSSVLPVSLLSFTGAQKNNNALLQWQTINEVNTSSFAVLRSTDGVRFTNIGNTVASGNNAGTKNYTYTDVAISSLGAPKLYYKLAITDKDGTITYSKTVQLDVAANKFAIILSPNPVTHMISLYSPVSIADAVVKINDMSGKTLYTSRQNILAGSKLNIDVYAFVKGMYIVTIQSATNKFEYKIVK